MLLTSRSSARRAGSLVAALSVMLAMFLVASPAQAAVSVDLNVDDTTITLGDSITLSWTSTEATTLQASGDSIWNGTKSTASGTQTEVVTPTTTGDHTYTLTATDVNGRESADSVTVTVAPGPITPNAVTFPDPCTVVIPTTPNVTYFVDFGDGDIQELDADTYDGGELSFGDEVTLFAEANDGFTLADGATTEWPYTAPDSCFDDEGPIDGGPELVETAVECGSVKFSNTTDGPIEILYGSFDEDDSDGELTLAAGESDAVKTKRAHFGFVASPDLEDEDAPVQIREIDVPQNCDGGSGEGNGNGNGSGHPTTAPAAGITAR
jgi:plastocyanin